MSKGNEILCFLCAILLPVFCGAQEWVVRYNGTASEGDIAEAIAIDNMGNVYVTGGSTGSGTGSDYVTAKYDSFGVEQWVARYDGPGSEHDGAYAIAIDNVGNVYVSGRSVGSGTSYDYATVKYDMYGAEQWIARYNGPNNDSDYAYGIAVDNTGDVYVTGWSKGSGTDWDYATVKYDNGGIEQWVARYNGPANGEDWANAIVLVNAGDVCVTGGSDGNVTGYDYATVKYNAFGVEQWVARYHGPDGLDIAEAIAFDSAGNLYVTGGSQASGTLCDYTTVKYNSSGVEQWVSRYNCPSDSNDFARDIAVDEEGCAYVTGYSEGSGMYADYVTVKYDSYGGEQWVSHYGMTCDLPTAIAIDDNGNVYVTGWSWGVGTDWDYATVKYDNGGIEQWVARYNGPANGDDRANAIVVDNAGYVYVTGGSTGMGTGWDYATVKYSPAAIQEQTAISVKTNHLTATIMNEHLQLPEDKKCRVYDITGRVVEPDEIAPGIYFVEIDNRVVQKVVKIR